MIKVHMSLRQEAVLFCFVLLCCSSVFAQFAGGIGTAEYPYQVATPEHLNNIRNFLSCQFIQTADIDLNLEPFNTGSGWNPLGIYVADDSPDNQPFTGAYNGNGHIIYNLYINRYPAVGNGLFGYADEAVLTNINIYNCNVAGGYRTAGLTGYSHNVTLDNCHVTGSVTGSGSTGGVAGICKGTDVTDCSAKCTIIQGGFYSGGLIGWAEYSNITNCYSRRSINGGGWVGGLIGWAPNSVVTDCYSSANVTATAKSCGGLVSGGWYVVINRCYATGNVNGHDDCGGLGGHMDSANITNSFARGDVTASNHHAGGLVGFDCVQTNISNSYSTGYVFSPLGAGGLVGGAYNTDTTLNCYWDMLTSGQSTSYGGAGRTTEQMVFPYAQDTYAGWDFTGIWQNDQHSGFNDGYPIFGYMIPVANEDEVIPEVSDVVLSNYPNPFRDMTTIRFDIPKSTKVSLSIYNSKGQLVRTLTDSQFSKGEYTLTWDGKADSGNPVSNGIYLYQLKGTDFSLTKKLMLMR